MDYITTGNVITIRCNHPVQGPDSIQLVGGTLLTLIQGYYAAAVELEPEDIRELVEVLDYTAEQLKGGAVVGCLEVHYWSDHTPYAQGQGVLLSVDNLSVVLLEADKAFLKYALTANDKWGNRE